MTCSMSRSLVVIGLDPASRKFQRNTLSFIDSETFVPGTGLFSLHPTAHTNYNAEKLF